MTNIRSARGDTSKNMFDIGTMLFVFNTTDSELHQFSIYCVLQYRIKHKLTL